MKRISFFILLFLLMGCSQNKIKLWTDYDIVYSISDEVKENYSIKGNRPFVANYFSLEGILWGLQMSTKGRVDKLIENNPDWDFVFYCNCSIADTTVLGEALRKLDCKIPVIIDTASKSFSINNFGKDEVGASSFTCNKDGEIYGGGVIFVKNPFDHYFQEAKIRLGYR